MGAELLMENYSGVLQIENCCPVGAQNDNRTV